MNLTEFFLNKYFASIFIIITSYLIYHELKRPWGLVFPTAALVGVVVLVNFSDNAALNYMIIGGIYGALLSMAEWIKNRFINKK
jgi:hypothetical protein